MKRFLSLTCVFLLIFAVVSCGDSKKEEKPAYEEQVTQEISAEEGGTVKNSNDSVSIEVPGGALDENLTITMTIYDAKGYVGTEGQKVVSKVVEFEPSGIVFKKPVIIRMAATEPFENQVVTAAVYRESKGEWSYSEHGTYAVLQGRDAAGDPIMTTAAGDPIMLSAAGDPIMMDADGNSSSLCAAGDPIMLASAGDPIMTNAAGDPIMTSAAGDPIMMTTGHFTAYTFITLDTGKPVEPNDNDDTDDTEEPVDDGDSEPAETDDDKPAETDDDEPVVETDDDEPAETDDDEPAETDDDEPVDEDITPAEPPVYSKVLCTGQLHCADGESIIDCPAPGEDFYGQNGNYAGRKACVPHKYTKVAPAAEESVEGGEPTGGDQTPPSYTQVIDENTGLKWLLLNEEAREEAIETRCEDLEYGGITDWRRPTPKEFFSVADHDRASPAAEDFYFKEFANHYTYWTSLPATALGKENEFWTFDTYTGELRSSSASHAYGVYIACVSGEEYGKVSAEYYTTDTKNGDGIVFDSSTNLMWQGNSVSGKTWKDALAYCENLNYAGYRDWRLPNKNELVTLLDYSRTEAPISQFPGMTSETFWTSTFINYYGGTDGIFYVNFEEGSIQYDGAASLKSVRCVRTSVDPYSETIPVCDETRLAPCEDSSTHYVWSKADMKSASTENLSWQSKAVQCRESRDGGIKKWRIPTIDEIRTLLGANDKLKTGGECSVTVACSDYLDATCFDDGKCSDEENKEDFQSSLYDNSGYIVSGTLTGDADDEDDYGNPIYSSWAVNLETASIVPLSGSNNYVSSASRCIKDDTLPDPVDFPYTDTANGIIWSELSKHNFYWYDAAKYCKNLVEGGSNNWRVPTLDELKTLVKNCPNGGCDADIIGKYSLFSELSTLWSSLITTDNDENQNQYFHTLDFMTASQMSSTYQYEEEKVRCVRSVSDPETAEEFSFPFEVYDLLWSKVSDKEYYDIADAEDYCDSLNAENYGGRTDWRLPEISEVAKLIRKAVCSNKENFTSSQPASGRCKQYTFDGYSFFGDMFSLKSSGRYTFDFAQGYMMTYTDNARVRCVADFNGQ
jgi:Cobalamin biosynthesis protein CobT (nicotinate-mononucleotide:5, 6-dimethylbenzimidazole phosphoribosyltransferase)